MTGPSGRQCHVDTAEHGRIELPHDLADILHLGLAATDVSKPTVAQYTLYFRHLQAGAFARELDSTARRSTFMVRSRKRQLSRKVSLAREEWNAQAVENASHLIKNFPEETLSWESFRLLACSHRSVLTVGFGFAAAANPI